MKNEIPHPSCNNCAPYRALKTAIEERDIFRARIVELAEADFIRHSLPSPSCLLLRAPHPQHTVASSDDLMRDLPLRP